MSIIDNSKPTEKPQEQEPKRIVIDANADPFAPSTREEFNRNVDLVTFAIKAEILNPALESVFSEYDEIQRRELGQTTSKLNNVSPIEFERLVVDLYARLAKLLDANPFIKAVRKELAKLQTNPAYKDAELDRLAFDEDEKQLANNAHNLALKLAIGNALATLSTGAKPKQNSLKGRGKGLSKGKVITSSWIRRAFTEGGIIGTGKTLSHHPFTHGSQEVKAITTSVQTEIPDDMVIEGGNLTDQEWEVLDGVHSLVLNNQFKFSVDEVYRGKTAGDTDQKPTPKKREEIRQTLYKLAKIKAMIDPDDELKHRNKKRRVFRDTLLHFAEEGDLTAEGFEPDTFVLTSVPILYLYASLTGGLIIHDREHFRVYKTIKKQDVDKDGKLAYTFHDPVPMTEARISINYSLIRRYPQMMREDGTLKRNQSPTILFEPIFRLAGVDVDNLDRDTLKDYKAFALLAIRNHVARGLTYGRGFKKKTEGRTHELVGVIIDAKEPLIQKTSPAKTQKAKLTEKNAEK